MVFTVLGQARRKVRGRVGVSGMEGLIATQEVPRQVVSGTAFLSPSEAHVRAAVDFARSRGLTLHVRARHGACDSAPDLCRAPLGFFPFNDLAPASCSGLVFRPHPSCRSCAKVGPGGGWWADLRPSPSRRSKAECAELNALERAAEKRSAPASALAAYEARLPALASGPQPPCRVEAAPATREKGVPWKEGGHAGVTPSTIKAISCMSRLKRSDSSNAYSPHLQQQSSVYCTFRTGLPACEPREQVKALGDSLRAQAAALPSPAAARDGEGVWASWTRELMRHATEQSGVFHLYAQQEWHPHVFIWSKDEGQRIRRESPPRASSPESAGNHGTDSRVLY